MAFSRSERAPAMDCSRSAIPTPARPRAPGGATTPGPPRARWRQSRKISFPKAIRMGNELSIALVGIGGYGIHYVTPLLDAVNTNSFQLVGAIDPTPAACKRIADLEARRVPIFSSLDDFQRA